jgi:hypothetical protein
MDYINVEPCELMQLITKIKINVLHIELNVQATIQTTCYDVYNKLLIAYVFELSGDEYQSWQNDKWLTEYILDKYGFSETQLDSDIQ